MLLEIWSHVILTMKWFFVLILQTPIQDLEKLTVLLKNTQLTTEPERKSGLSDFKSTDHFVVRVSHPSPTIFGAWAEKSHS